MYQAIGKNSEKNLLHDNEATRGERRQKIERPRKFRPNQLLYSDKPQPI